MKQRTYVAVMDAVPLPDHNQFAGMDKLFLHQIVPPGIRVCDHVTHIGDDREFIERSACVSRSIIKRKLVRCIKNEESLLLKVGDCFEVDDAMPEDGTDDVLYFIDRLEDTSEAFGWYPARLFETILPRSEKTTPMIYLPFNEFRNGHRCMTAKEYEGHYGVELGTDSEAIIYVYEKGYYIERTTTGNKFYLNLENRDWASNNITELELRLFEYFCHSEQPEHPICEQSVLDYHINLVRFSDSAKLLNATWDECQSDFVNDGRVTGYPFPDDFTAVVIGINDWLTCRLKAL